MVIMLESLDTPSMFLGPASLASLKDIKDADSQVSPQTHQVRNPETGPSDLCITLSPGEADAGSSLTTSVL